MTDAGTLAIGMLMQRFLARRCLRGMRSHSRHLSRAARGTVYVAAALLGTLAPAVATAQRTLVLDGVHLVDVDGDSLLRDRAIVVRDGRIVAIERAGAGPRRGARRVDLKGRYVIPGLWDMHVHLLSASRIDAVQRQLHQLLGYGVLGVRDMGSFVDSSLAILPALRADTLAPRITWVGPLLDGAKFRWSQRVAWHVTTTEEAARAVDSLARLEVNALKVYGSLNAREFREVMRTARQVGLPVVGHLPRGVSVTAAAEAGMRSIEHGGLDVVMWCAESGPARVGRVLDRWVREGYGGRFAEMETLWAARDTTQCRSQERAMSRAGTYVTPTLVLEMKDSSTLRSSALGTLDSTSLGYCRGTVAAIEQAPRASRERVFAQLLSDVRSLRDNGVRVLAGTDLGNPCLVPGASLHDELALFVRAGLTPLEALRAATTDAARAGGLSNDWIGLRVGNVAELVVLDADPRVGLETARTPRGVVHGGRWLDAATLQKLRVP
jgi:imidazolonepropionase-like amidohydrolase